MCKVFYVLVTFVSSGVVWLHLADLKWNFTSCHKGSWLSVLVGLGMFLWSILLVSKPNGDTR